MYMIYVKMLYFISASTTDGLGTQVQCQGGNAKRDR